MFDEVSIVEVEYQQKVVHSPQQSISHKLMSQYGKARLRFQLGLSTLNSWLGPNMSL